MLNLGGNAQDKDEVKEVGDPMSIVSRMQSQLAMVTSTSDVFSATNHHLICTQDDDADGKGAMEWNQRISRYFAFCVDGGWSGAHMTFCKLVKVSRVFSLSC